MAYLSRFVFAAAFCSTFGPGFATPNFYVERQFDVSGCTVQTYGQACVMFGGTQGTCQPEPDGIDLPYCKAIYSFQGCSALTLGTSCIDAAGEDNTCVQVPDPWDAIYDCGVQGQP